MHFNCDERKRTAAAERCRDPNVFLHARVAIRHALQFAMCPCSDALGEEGG
jgi:hypothetical protein